MISDRLDQLAISTLNNALAVLSRGEDLWPVAILATKNDFELQQFSDDAPEECWKAACEYVNAAEIDVMEYAICYDGHAEVEFISASGEKTLQNSDALIVEFGERGQEGSYSMVTPYRGFNAPGGFEIIGETALTTEAIQLLN